MGASRRSRKVGRAISKFKEGTLRKGHVAGPKVKSKRQAKAIGLAQAREKE